MTLVVQVEEIARRLGLEQPLEEGDRWIIEQAIGDAQSDLEAYLGRPVSKGTYTQEHLFRYCNGYELTYFPVHEVISETPEEYDGGQPTGRYTVVYVAGLDGKADPELEPIRRFIKMHAMYSPMVQAMFRRLAPEAARRAQSLSVEGQSVTYADTYATDAQASALGLPGGLPAMKSCARWKIAGRLVHQAPTRVDAPWPFDDPYGNYYGSGQWWA